MRDNINELIRAEFGTDETVLSYAGDSCKIDILKSRLLQRDVALCVNDKCHVFSWAGEHCERYKVPTLNLCPSQHEIQRKHAGLLEDFQSIFANIAPLSAVVLSIAPVPAIEAADDQEVPIPVEKLVPAAEVPDHNIAKQKHQTTISSSTGSNGSINSRCDDHFVGEREEQKQDCSQSASSTFTAVYPESVGDVPMVPGLYITYPPLIPDLSLVPTGRVVAGPVFPSPHIAATQSAADEKRLEDLGLKQWLDDDQRPVVYVSLGSMVKHNFNVASVNRLLIALCSRPCSWRVLSTVQQQGEYRSAAPSPSSTSASAAQPRERGADLDPLVEEESIQSQQKGALPNHYLNAGWVPQQAVLKHPKVRAFVTHCGANSIHEAIYHGVPMVAFPFFDDQRYNGPKLVELNLASACLLKDSFTDAEVISAVDTALRIGQFASSGDDRSTPPLHSMNHNAMLLGDSSLVTNTDSASAGGSDEIVGNIIIGIEEENTVTHTDSVSDSVHCHGSQGQLYKIAAAARRIIEVSLELQQPQANGLWDVMREVDRLLAFSWKHRRCRITPAST